MFLALQIPDKIQIKVIELPCVCEVDGVVDGLLPDLDLFEVTTGVGLQSVEVDGNGTDLDQKGSKVINITLPPERLGDSQYSLVNYYNCPR